jgi:hypothetical protein
VIPAYDCDNPAEPCCTCLYDTTAALVNAAADAVIACIGVELCRDFGRSVHIAEPVGPGDYVAGWLGTFSVAPTAQTRPGSKQLLAPRLLAPVNIRLVESGFPDPLRNIAGRLALPERSQLDYVSWHFYGHAEAATRALLNVQTPACGRGCESIRFINSSAMQPQTNWMAWNWSFEAKLVW